MVPEALAEAQGAVAEAEEQGRRREKAAKRLVKLEGLDASKRPG